MRKKRPSRALSLVTPSRMAATSAKLPTASIWKTTVDEHFASLLNVAQCLFIISVSPVFYDDHIIKSTGIREKLIAEADFIPGLVQPPQPLALIHDPRIRFHVNLAKVDHRKQREPIEKGHIDAPVGCDYHQAGRRLNILILSLFQKVAQGPLGNQAAQLSLAHWEGVRLKAVCQLIGLQHYTVQCLHVSHRRPAQLISARPVLHIGRQGGRP
ncbi:hypothetical protein TYRP_000162 [Tyrophagus putrescentiae]|nr:hypothetical protein TYRP_000162 [Tyrophagus putrescentiae]